jgi:hypothetical protein
MSLLLLAHSSLSVCACVDKSQQRAHVEELLRAFYATHNSSKVKPPHVTRHTSLATRHTSHATLHYVTLTPLQLKEEGFMQRCSPPHSVLPLFVTLALA